MVQEVVLAAFLFVVAISITPGPNNIMLASSGASFGIAKTIPHIFGISSGVLAMFSASAFGVNALYEAFPNQIIILKVIGSVYVIYLASRIWKLKKIGEESAEKPIGFFEAFTFQFLNPKAWVMVLNISALYISMLGYEALALILFLTNLVCISVWAVFGFLIRNSLLRSQKRLILFNRSMAVLLAFCIPFVFF